MCALAGVIPQSILLYGPAGCGKSLLAHAMLNEATPEQPHIDLKTSELLQDPNSVVSSLTKLQQFEMFGLTIEQVDDFLAALRGFPGPHRYLVEQLRSPKCVTVIVGTARRPEALRQEELDAFEHVLPLLFPDEQARVKILERHARDLRREPSVRLDEIGLHTEWWSGKELKDLVQSALRDGTLSQRELLKRMNLVNDHMRYDIRRTRMRELLKFTTDHCTDKKTKEEVMVRFSDILSQAESSEPSKVPHAIVQVNSMFVMENIMGDKVRTGDVYGGIVGGHFHKVNLTQTWNQIGGTVELAELAGQLSLLRAELLKRARDPEQYAEIGAISSAEIEAKKGDGPKSLEYLSKAGRWAFDVATTVGATLAAEVLKKTLGIS
jgi:hypothetical protein